jgi:hypothetical protein
MGGDKGQMRLGDFVELVIPELRRRNLFRTDDEAATLRGNLGLPPAALPDLAATD